MPSRAGGPRHALWRAVSALLALSALLAGVGLTGCAVPPQATPQERIPNAYWSGRLALRVDDDQNSIDPAMSSRSFSAAFTLQGSAEQGELVLSTALGTVLARLLWQQASAQLEHDGQVHHAPDIAALLTQLGVPALPLAALFDWLQGHPTPAAGWQVDLGAVAEGRLSAQRLHPLPQATLRIVLR